MAKIAISYRRDDTKAATHMLFERLQGHFGRASVFLDFDSIGPGEDFREHIAGVLNNCDLVLAMIGPHWRGQKGARKTRITDEMDWVRVEMETALARKVLIIPVLVDDTVMPKPEQLPESIRNLVFLNATRIDTGMDFSQHAERLIKAIERRFPAMVPEAAKETTAETATARPAEAPREIIVKPSDIVVEDNPAAKIKRPAAPAHDAYALYNFAMPLMAKPKPMPEKPVEAKPQSRAPKPSEPPPASAYDDFHKGETAYDSKDYTGARQWYRKAADAGVVDAQHSLGLLFEKGLGGAQDHIQAAEFYRSAAEQGSADAQLKLGWLYRNGLGVPQDYAQAIIWHGKAAEQDQPDAQYSLGWIYENGLGVDQDYTQAAHWYLKAAALGLPDAQLKAGWLYHGGKGVPQDIDKARLWMKRAAAAGIKRAQIWLTNHPA